MIRKTDNIRTIIFCLLAGLCINIIGWKALAAQPIIKSLDIKQTNNQLALSFTLDGIFTPKMVSAIEQGLHLKMIFSISLFKARKFWFDKKIITVHASQHFRYQALKDKFLIERSWSKQRVSNLEDLANAKRTVERIKDVVIVPLKRLEKGEHYKIRVRSKLVDDAYMASRIPLTFKADWYVISFIYQ